MSIPRITPYPMPRAEEFEPSRAPWRPDPRRAAILIHDMQRWFVEFLPAGQSPTVPLVENIGRLRAAARRAGIPILYSAQPPRMSRAERGLLYDLWGPGMTKGDATAADFVPRLTPEPDDQVVIKSRYSAFFRTDLAARLAALGRDQLVVCGVFAHIGCLFTAADALALGIEPFLVADAMADFSRDDHLLALDYAGRRCAVTTTTAQLVNRFRPPAPADAAA